MDAWYGLVAADDSIPDVENRVSMYPTYHTYHHFCPIEAGLGGRGLNSSQTR